RHHRHIRRPPPRISPATPAASIHDGRVHLPCNRRPDGRRRLSRNGPWQPDSPVGRLGSASSRSPPAPDHSRASRTLIPDSEFLGTNGCRVPGFGPGDHPVGAGADGTLLAVDCPGVFQRHVGLERNHSWRGRPQIASRAPSERRHTHLCRSAGARPGSRLFHICLVPRLLLDRVGQGQTGLARQNRRDACRPSAPCPPVGLRLSPKPFRDSHRYRRMYKGVSGVLSVVYPCTFLSSTPLSWGCETIRSSRWLPSGRCSQSWSHVRSFTPCCAVVACGVAVLPWSVRGN